MEDQVVILPSGGDEERFKKGIEEKGLEKYRGKPCRMFWTMRIWTKYRDISRRNIL